MNLQTVRKVVTAGILLSIASCAIGLFAGGGNPQVYQYSLVVAVVALLLTIAVIMKWARCPWCGGSLLRGFFKNKTCPHCHRDLESGKKKKGHGGRGRK